MYMRAFIRQKVNACITKVTINNLGKKSSSIGPFSLEIDVIKVTEQKQPNTHTPTGKIMRLFTQQKFYASILEVVTKNQANEIYNRSFHL
jgi:hypothetical protein